MLKKVFCLLLLAVVGYRVAGQPTEQDAIRQIQNKLRSATDTNRLNLYQDIFWKYLTYNTDSAGRYADLAIGLAQQLNHKRSLGSAYRNKARYFYAKMNFSEALDYYLKSYSAYNEIGYKTGLANVLHDLGILYMEAEYPFKAQPYFEESIANRDTNTLEAMTTYFMLSNIYYLQGKEEQGRDFFNKYYDRYKKIAPSKANSQKKIFEVQKAAYLEQYQVVIHKVDSILNGSDKHVLTIEDVALLHYAKGNAMFRAQPTTDGDNEIETYLSNAFGIGKSLDLYSVTIESGQRLVEFYERNQRYKDAYILVKEVEKFKQKYKEKRNLFNMSLKLRAFEEEKRFQEMKTLSAERKALKAKLAANQKQDTIMLVIGLSVVILLGLITYGYYRTKKYMERLAKQNQKYKILNQELEKANQELDKFMYRSSHDLLAPLASTQGLLQLIWDKSEQKGISSYTRMAMTTLTKIDYFVKDITEYGKTKATDHNGNWFEINLLSKFNDVLDQLHFVAGYQSTRFEVKIKEDETLKTSPVLFEQVMQNLLSNAIKFSAAHSKIPQVSIKTQDQPEGFKTILITDNGPGIAEGNQTRIFEMFEKLNSDMPGSGLGLYIAREAANNLQAKIVYRLLPNNQGSEFAFMHPCP